MSEVPGPAWKLTVRCRRAMDVDEIPDAPAGSGPDPVADGQGSDEHNSQAIPQMPRPRGRDRQQGVQRQETQVSCSDTARQPQRILLGDVVVLHDKHVDSRIEIGNDRVVGRFDDRVAGEIE